LLLPILLLPILLLPILLQPILLLPVLLLPIMLLPMANAFREGRRTASVVAVQRIAAARPVEGVGPEEMRRGEAMRRCRIECKNTTIVLVYTSRL
jgi:hypothetical protein